jgi:hypothetical protein
VGAGRQGRGRGWECREREGKEGKTSR